MKSGYLAGLQGWFGKYEGYFHPGYLLKDDGYGPFPGVYAPPSRTRGYANPGEKYWYLPRTAVDLSSFSIYEDTGRSWPPSFTDWFKAVHKRDAEIQAYSFMASLTLTNAGTQRV